MTRRTTERQLAVFAGTFDPLTNGHLDLIRRAARCFSELVVCVSGAGRPTWFSADERIALVREATADLGNVRVQGFEGLLVAEARRLGARFLVRGVRGAKDLETELPMAFANRSLEPGLETLFLTPGPGLDLVSSSLVREVSQLGGDASAWVPPVVAEALRHRRAPKA